MWAWTMFQSGQGDQLEGLKSRPPPLLNLFVNFPFNHAMLPAVEQAFPDVSDQERSYREPRIPSFASSGTPGKSKSRGVELIRDPADGSSCERKVVGTSSKPVADGSWSVSPNPLQDRVTMFDEDEIPKAARKVRPASQGSELQVSVRNDTASRERKSVFRRLSRPVSVFERLSSSPTGDDNGPCGDFDPPLPGMIVGCTRNSVRKFMDLKIFGQPVARQSLVLRVVPGTKLFLFNYHTKELYGVYEATSRGKLRPRTLVVDSKDLLAQVSWKMWEKCPNLHISVFRRAIEENFVNNKFKFDLNQAQVDSLVDLFMASNTPPLKSARRKVERVPLPLERATKKPRRFKDSEAGRVGCGKEEMDAKVSFESYTRPGAPVGVKRPILDRSLPIVSKNNTRTRKGERGWSPGIFPTPTSASPTPALTIACVGADWESSAGKQLTVYQQERGKSESAGISDHILSPAEPKTSCMPPAEEHEFLCVEMRQLYQHQSILESNNGGWDLSSRDSEAANSEIVKYSDESRIVTHFGNCTGIICGENNSNLKIKKGGPSLTVDDAYTWPTTDVSLNTSIGRPGALEGPLCIAGLDLNRPAFEDEDDFLEVEKYGLETDSGDGDEYMEDQPSQSKIPMRTLEDLKPMKLLSNFRPS